MSYRTRINGVQLFGNGESYDAWAKFIEQQGIEIGEDGQYEGEITDFMAALEACEACVMETEASRKELLERGHSKAKSIFDFTHIPAELAQQNEASECRSSLFDELYELVHYGYAFIPLVLYEACREHLERVDGSCPGHLRAYRIKPGHKITVEAG